MFERAGLNIARHDDNGSNPSPDNRTGWLQGETPDVVSQTLSAEPPPAFEVSLWDPSTQLRYAPKRSVPPRPDGAPNSGAGRVTREAAARDARAA